MFDTEIRTDSPGERAQSVARVGRPAWTVEARALLVLAAPLVASQLAQMGLLTTDVVMLGRLDAHALAAAAIGNTVYYFAWLLGLGPASAVAPMVAHILGDWAGDRAGVRSVARMGLWTAMLGSLPLMLILLAARPILVHLGQDPSLAADAGRFVAMLCIGLPFSLGFQVLRNLCTALGRPGATLWVTAASVAWNALADYALIFGHFGLPRLGIVGAGLATSSSSIFAFTALFLLIQAIPHLRAYRLLRRAHRPHWPRLSELLRLGAPIGATMIFENMLFNSMTLLVGAFGVDAVAAHQVALNICSLTFMVPLGIGMAAAVRVGRHAGGGDLDQARRAGFIAMALGAVFMTVSGLAMLAFGRQIVGLYVAGHTAAELQVIALAVTFLHIAAAFQVFDGLQVVGAFNLRGLKDARAPMVLAAASYWLVGAPVCVWLGVGVGWKGVGVWIGLVAGLAAAALSLGLRFHLLTRRARRRSAGRPSAVQG